jgi:hypothetical protein
VGPLQSDGAFSRRGEVGELGERGTVEDNKTIIETFSSTKLEINYKPP